MEIQRQITRIHQKIPYNLIFWLISLTKHATFHIFHEGYQLASLFFLCPVANHIVHSSEPQQDSSIQQSDFLTLLFLSPQKPPRHIKKQLVAAKLLFLLFSRLLFLRGILENQILP